MKIFRKAPYFHRLTSRNQIQQPMVAKSEKIQKQQSKVAKCSSIELPFFPQLSWMHYESLMRVADTEARLWYMQEAASQQ